MCASNYENECKVHTVVNNSNVSINPTGYITRDWLKKLPGCRDLTLEFDKSRDFVENGSEYYIHCFN